MWSDGENRTLFQYLLHIYLFLDHTARPPVPLMPLTFSDSLNLYHRPVNPVYNQTVNIT